MTDVQHMIVTKLKELLYKSGSMRDEPRTVKASLHCLTVNYEQLLGVKYSRTRLT